MSDWRAIKYDLVGQTFGRWTVVERLLREDLKRRGPMWLCRCECGEEKESSTHNLRNHKNESCGSCNPKNFDDKTGQRFGKLVCLSWRKKDSGIGILWNCQCDCGATAEVDAGHLSNEHTRSCGCLHGELKKPDDEIFWSRTISSYRTAAENRGLEWLLTDEQAVEMMSKDCFYCGMNPQPARFHTGNWGGGRWVFLEKNGIDRVDNDRGYSMTNCVPCCKEHNRAKDAMSAEDFVSSCQKVARRFEEEAA